MSPIDSWPLVVVMFEPQGYNDICEMRYVLDRQIGRETGLSILPLRGPHITWPYIYDIKAEVWLAHCPFALGETLSYTCNDSHDRDEMIFEPFYLFSGNRHGRKMIWTAIFTVKLQRWQYCCFHYSLGVNRRPFNFKKSRDIQQTTQIIIYVTV